MGEVRLARRGDVPAVAAALGRAFADDPVAAYIFPDASHREERLSRFFCVQLLHNYLPRGEVYTVSGGVAAALWMPPAPLAPRTRDVLAHLRLVPLLSGRFLATRRLSMLLAARHPSSRHYYLGTIGTDPARQRRGVGSALLAPVLERCDADRLPAYLECSKRENVEFYGRHGFVVTGEVAAPGGGPPLWLMWREPATG
ncbi:MAG: GNAT family N-acetyltransferase [Acidimicrobiales bacterium]